MKPGIAVLRPPGWGDASRVDRVPHAKKMPAGVVNRVDLSIPAAQQYSGYIYIISVRSEAIKMRLPRLLPESRAGITQFRANRSDPLGCLLAP
jgi:hypothetical protein